MLQSQAHLICFHRLSPLRHFLTHSSGPLSLFEVEGYVRSLECLPLTAVGSDRWSTQHDHLEQLNIQAHADAQAGKHDEYVVEQFVAQDKVATLVHELLVIEAWKEKVFPLLIDHLSPVTAVKAYIVVRMTGAPPRCAAHAH